MTVKEREWSEPYSPITYGVAPTYIKSGHKFDVTYNSHEIEITKASDGSWGDTKANPKWYPDRLIRDKLKEARNNG